MARQTFPVYATKTVFAAACAAQRVNGEYLKYSALNDEAGTSRLANKILIHSFLKGDIDIREEDVQLAEKVMSYCNQLSFKILADKRISDFEQTMMLLAEKSDIHKHYDISVISSIPGSYFRSLATRDLNQRLNACEGFVGEIGERVQVTGEIVRSRFNDEFAIYFNTVITNDNKQVFFAHRNKLEIGSIQTFTGKVKAHRETATQLNYVKFS